MSLRDQRRSDTTERIHGAARDLLEQEGLGGLTFRALAERAGVSVGTVHNYAGSKTELVVNLLVDDLSAVIQARQAEPPGATLIDTLMVRFGGFFELYAARPSLARASVLETAFAKGPGYDRYMTMTVEFVVGIAALLEGSGRLRPHVPALVAARVLFDTYISVVVQYLREEVLRAESGQAQLRGAFTLILPILCED